MTRVKIGGLLRTVGLLAAVVALGEGIAVGQTVYTWTGGTDSDWGTTTNWSGGSVAPTNGTYGNRISVTGGQPLVYTSALGTTTYNPAGTASPTFGRGLVTSGNSSFEVQSGSFTSDGGQSTIIALNAGTSTLTVSGGSFTSGNLWVGWSGGGGNGVVDVTGGTLTAALVTLGGSGSETGTINLTAGTLAVNNITSGTGTGTTRVLLNGGTLQARQTTTSFASIAIDEFLIGAAGGLIDSNGFSITIPKDITPDVGSTGGLTKTGTGTLTLTGTNTYAGTTSVQAGTLTVSSATALPGFATAGRVSVASSGALAVGDAFADADLDALLAAATFDAGSTLALDTGAADRTLAGGLTGGLGLGKLGGNTLTLSGANTYSGPTTVQTGILQVANNDALGTTSGITITTTGASGVVQLLDGITVSGRTITVSGYGTNVRGALQAGENATATWAGDVVIGSVTGSIDDRVGAMAGGRLTISGQIRNGTRSDLAISGENAAGASPGTVIISGTNNTYTGATQVFRGVLALGADNALPTGTLLDVHAASSVTDAARFDLNGFDQQVGGLRRGNASGPAEVTNSGGTVKTLTINNTAAYTFDSPITGNLSLTKSGTGTQTLSGANTYTGTTTVSGGTLLVNGSLAATTVSVGSGATLGGSGTIGGPTSILAGGILSPGTSPGTLAVNNTLALAGSSLLAFEIDAGDPSSSVLNDLITGVTDLTLGGTLNLTGTGDFSSVTEGTTWRLFNYTGSLTDNALAIGTAPTLAAGLSFTVDTSTANEVNLVVVPEPGFLPLLGGGLMAGFLLRRRR